MLKRSWILAVACLLTFAVACSGDEAKDAATEAASNVEESASDMMNHAGDAMDHAANAVADTARSAASDLAETAVSACRQFAESGAWGQALEVCKKAHEMMPDDLGLEHAYQQAQAAAAH